MKLSRLASLPSFKLLTGTALLSLGALAFAAPGADTMGHSGPHGRHEMTAERQQDMAKKMAERQAKLKQTLQISAAQEPAWNAFVAAMTPPKPMARPSHEEMEKLSTPQRIDRMQALHAEHSKHMNERMEATKRFYAALTPEQQKRFDAEHHRGMKQGREGGHKDRAHAHQ